MMRKHPDGRTGDARQDKLQWMQPTNHPVKMSECLVKRVVHRKSAGDVIVNQKQQPTDRPADPADRNLLVAIIALQMNFVTRDALIRAMQHWTLDKGRPIEQIFVTLGDMTTSTQALLTALVEKHLELHHGSAERSLAALSSADEIKDELKLIQDDDLNNSITRLASDQQYATQKTIPWERSSDDGRYRILRPYRSGGLGSVSIAIDRELNREVALKEVRRKYAGSRHAQDRLRIEAEITGRLEHPGVVPVYGLGTHADGIPFYCMRFIRGDSLKEAIEDYHQTKNSLSRSERNLALRGLLHRMIDVCDAITYAHSRRVLHRDLKPGNIMLGKYGETLVVDWGLAKAAHDSVQREDFSEQPIVPRSGSTAAPTKVGTKIGTPEYMSPEQAQGRIDELGPATDIYSLGATLFCLLTGRPPIVERDSEVAIRKARDGEFPRPTSCDASVSKPLEAICLKAMKLDPQQRYATPRAMADDIERWLADESVWAYSDRPLEALGRLVRRHRAAAFASVAFLTAALIGLLVTNLIVRNKNRQLTAANTALSTAQLQLEEDFANARSLAFDMVEQAEIGENSLAQIRDAQKHRLWMTNRAIEVYEPLLERNPDDPSVKREMARLYRFAANLDRLNGDLEEAATKYQSAIAHLEEIVADRPDDVLSRDTLSLTLSDYAPMLRMAGRLEESRDQLEKSEGIVRSLRNADPESMNYRRNEALVAMEFAIVLSELARPAEALQRSKKCSELFRVLVESEQVSPTDGILLHFSLVKDSELLRELKRLDEAEATAREAVERSAAALETSQTRGSRHAAAKALLELGKVLREKDAPFGGHAGYIRDAGEIWSELAAGFSTSQIYPRYYAVARGELGKSKFADGQLDGGREDFEFAIQSLTNISEERATTTNLEALSDALFSYAESERTYGNPEDSRQLLERAVAHLQSAAEQDGESVRLANKLTNLRAQLN